MPSLQISDAGEYECRAGNGVGDAKSTKIQVDVELKPTFRSELASQTVREGATVTFTCDAEATGDVVYNWIFNGRVLSKDGELKIGLPVSFFFVLCVVSVL